MAPTAGVTGTRAAHIQLKPRRRGVGGELHARDRLSYKPSIECIRGIYDDAALAFAIPFSLIFCLVGTKSVEGRLADTHRTVSYTHLTLPTKA